MKKTKLLTSVMAVGACGGLVVPLVTTATSCSKGKDYSAIAKEVEEEALKIFKETVCSVRHKSWDCGAILAKYKEIVETELKDVESEHKWVTDTYQADYLEDHPEWTQETRFGSVYSNAYFEIPATKGCENWERIILQGHMDMVEDGFTTETAVNVEESTKDGRKILHVKDDKTSLGADNGVGIAIMLALLKKRNDFDHGPIRCLIVADEEPGMVGAKYVPAEWLDAKYLLNIDNENEGDLVKSCAGGYSMNYTSDLSASEDTDTVKTTDTMYEIKLTGLKKSHSADVTVNMCNAIKEVNRFLSTNYSAEDDVKLISFETPSTDIDATNTIPVTAVAKISSKINHDQKEKCDVFAAKFQAEIRDKYSEEQGALFTIENLGSPTSDTKKCLNTARTKNFYDCIDQLKFGPISFLDQEKKILESSSNIGPICVNFELTDAQKAKGYTPLMVKFYSRSCNNSIMDLIKAHNTQSCKNLTDNFGKTTTAGAVTGKELASFPGWAPDDKNELIDWCVAHYNQLGIKSTVSIIHGGVEPAWWVNKKPGLVTTSIGPTIVGPHTAGEHVFLDTYYNMTKVVMSVLDKMAK